MNSSHFKNAQDILGDERWGVVSDQLTLGGQGTEKARRKTLKI